MMDNVVKLYPANAAENADNVLERALGVFGDVLIIGWDNDGDLEARATSTINVGEILVLLEQFKMKLLSGDYMDED